MTKELIESPASFRVIGVGNGIETVINKVRSFGFDCVSAEVIKYPFDCTPNDCDKLAIVVFVDCDDNANRIAKIFHDSGVLTIGFSEDAETSCYDSVMPTVCATNAPAIIKALLQPIVTPSKISYDFKDLCTTLRDSDFFIVKTTTGDTVSEASTKLQGIIAKLDIGCADSISINLYFNPMRPIPIATSDMACLSEFMSNLPESANTVWSVNYDDQLDGNKTILSVLIAGKEIWKCSND